MSDYPAWEYRMLGDIVGFVGGNGFPERFQGACHGDIPFFKVSDMSLAGNERFLTRANNYVSRELAASRNWSVVPAGGVAFAKVGAALLLNRRRIMTSDALVDNNMMAAVPGTEVHPTWLYWWLQTVDFGLFVQPGALPSVNQGHLRSLRVFLPHYSEQSRIAVVLNTVDEAIAKTEAVIAKLKQVRAGLLHDLLTRGLDLSACEAQAGEHGQLRDPIAHPEQFKNSPLGRIPRDWETLPLKRVALVDRGKFTHRPRNDPAFYGGDFPFIQTGDVALASGESITEASQRLNERGVSVSKEFPAGTIAVTIAADIGDTTILGRPMYFPGSVVGIIPQAPHSIRWIELSLRRAKGRLNALAPQSAQKNINLEFLRPLLIPVPQPLEQKECSKVYEAVNNQIRAESQALEKFVNLKSGLMNDLLTGRVRVPESISIGDSQS